MSVDVVRNRKWNWSIKKFDCYIEATQKLIIISINLPEIHKRSGFFLNEVFLIFDHGGHPVNIFLFCVCRSC